MNNSQVANSLHLDPPKETDKKALIQEREARLVRIIEAIGEVQGTTGWSTLKTELFDELPKRIKRDLLQEARVENPNTNKLNRLTGELKWAEKFADLQKLADSHKVELKGLKLLQHESE